MQAFHSSRTGTSSRNWSLLLRMSDQERESGRSNRAMEQGAFADVTHGTQ